MGFRHKREEEVEREVEERVEKIYESFYQPLYDALNEISQEVFDAEESLATQREAHVPNRHKPWFLGEPDEAAEIYGDGYVKGLKRAIQIIGDQTQTHHGSSLSTNTSPTD